MSMTTFRPDVDGYAFTNSWRFDEAEKNQIQGILSGALVPMAAALAPMVAPLGPAAPIIMAGAGAWAARAIAHGLNDVYGRCGGMAFAPLDYFRSGLPLPRGGPLPPERGDPRDAILRDYIYRRLIDSLTLNAATTLAWMAVLKLTPFNGGTGNLKNMSRAQLDNLKRHLDSGTPWPLGLIGPSDNPTENHQVLAVGYEDHPDRTTTVFVYDNNCPGETTTIKADFSNNNPFDYSCRGNPALLPLQGFFCEAYTPATPPPVRFTGRPGAARDIAVGDDRSVWVIGTNAVPGGHGIFRWNGSGWSPVAGGGERIAVASDGAAWVVNSAGQIFRREGDGWRQLPGAARDIGAGHGEVWIIGTDPVPGGFSIHRLNDDGASWTTVPGGAVRIDVDACGMPWVVNSGGQIFRREGDAWQLLPGLARDIGAGASGWVVGTDAVPGGFGIYRFDGADWARVPGGAVSISAGRENLPWVANSDGAIFEFALG